MKNIYRAGLLAMSLLGLALALPARAADTATTTTCKDGTTSTATGRGASGPDRGVPGYAGIFGALLFLVLLAKAPRSTMLYFVPAALVPLLAFFATQYLAFGQFKPVYEEFGTKSYNYEGSYWNTPLEFDWFNKYLRS